MCDGCTSSTFLSSATLTFLREVLLASKKAQNQACNIWTYKSLVIDSFIAHYRIGKNFGVVKNWLITFNASFVTEKLEIGLSVWGLRSFFKGPSGSGGSVVLSENTSHLSR